MNAAVTGVGPWVVLGRQGEQVRRSIRPEAAAGGEAGHALIGPPRDDQAAGAFQQCPPDGIGDDGPSAVEGTQKVLLLDELVRKAIVLEIRVVVALAQPHPNRIEPGGALDGAQRVADDRPQAANRLST